MPISDDAARAEQIRDIAEILARGLDRLFNSQGRIRSQQTTPDPSHLIQVLGTAFTVDEPVPDLLEKYLGDHLLANCYRDFFRGTEYLRSLPASVSLLGISCPMGPQIFPALLLARCIKELRPDVRVLMGGPSWSLMARSELDLVLRTERSIDAVVLMEGEIPLAALTEQAQARRFCSASCRCCWGQHD